MSERSDARWRSIARSLQIVGGLGFVAFFLSFLILVLVYFSSLDMRVPLTLASSQTIQ
jgi:Na+-transporting methylmalonyl-CoA/oxaloacetate decarboxylase gamma subunit